MSPKPIKSFRQIFPCLITISALFSGFLSIIFTIRGMITSQSEFYNWGALLIFLALILDGLDGNVARWINGQSDFGAELDTYVDFTSFGIAPSVLVFAITLLDYPLFIRIISPFFIVLIGAIRLSRFRVNDPNRGLGGYTGLPITVNAAFISLVTLIIVSPYGIILSGFNELLFFTGILVLTLLQITNIHYPTPTKNIILFIPCVLVVSVLWILNFFSIVHKVGWTFYLLAIGFTYTFIVPLILTINKYRKSKKKPD